MRRYVKVKESAIDNLLELADSNGINKTDILVLMVMAILSVYTGEYFVCKKSKEFIAKKMRMSRETIKKSITRLKTKNLISFRYRYKIVTENKTKYTTNIDVYESKRILKGIIGKEAHYIINDIGVQGTFTSK